MFTTESHPYMTAAELKSRCTAAARLSLRGEGYTPEDRAECAADVMARVLAKHGANGPSDRTGEPTGRPCADSAERARMLRQLDSMLRRHPSYWDFLRTRAEIALRREDVRFSYLTHLAANFRRSLDAQRDRDAQDGALRAAEEGFVPRVMQDGPTTWILTPDSAHRAALEIVTPLGLSGHYGAYLHAYCAARLTGAAALGAELPLTLLAAELGWDGATAAKTLGMALSRARKTIPSAGHLPMDDHLRAVHLLDTGGVALKPSRSRNLSATVGDSDWRSTDGITRAVDSRTERSAKRDGRRRYARPQWAQDMERNAPATAARLARAAELRIARTRAADHLERARIDTERGAVIPALPSHAE